MTEDQIPVLRLMQALPCFERRVCQHPPCECAQSLIDAIQGPLGEVARLRVLADELGYADQIAELKAKIERLTAALQSVVDHDPATPGLHYNSIELSLASAVGIARRALEGK